MYKLCNIVVLQWLILLQGPNKHHLQCKSPGCRKVPVIREWWLPGWKRGWMEPVESHMACLWTQHPKSTPAPPSQARGRPSRSASRPSEWPLPACPCQLRFLRFPLNSHMLSSNQERRHVTEGGEDGKWENNSMGKCVKVPIISSIPIINNLSSPIRKKSRGPHCAMCPSRCHPLLSCDLVLWCRLIPSMCD